MNLPPRPGQDIGRDFEIISRAVRRTILLWHAIADGKLPIPAAPRPESGRAPNPAASGRERSDAGTRLDPFDRLDDISGPFEHVVAAIVQDIQTVLASTHPPLEPAGAPSSSSAPSPSSARSPSGATPDRPEADIPDLE